MWVSPEIVNQIYRAEQAERDVRLERQRMVAELRKSRPRRDWFAGLRVLRRDVRRKRVARVPAPCGTPACA